MTPLVSASFDKAEAPAAFNLHDVAAPTNALREQEGGEELEGEDDLEKGREQTQCCWGRVPEVGTVEMEKSSIAHGEVEG
jgi:hypothetical protein